MSEVTLVWEGALEPTGTLFRDDLEEVEELFTSEKAEVEWSLQGRRELGSAKVTASTIDEIAGLRNQILDPESLELEVREGDWPRDEWFKANIHVVRESQRHNEGSWRASISGTEGYRDRYENGVRGIADIFGKASQTTWARQHNKVRSVVSHAPISLAIGIIVMWYVLIAFRVDWRIGTTTVVGYLIVLAGSYVLKRRIESNASWELHPSICGALAHKCDRPPRLGF